MKFSSKHSSAATYRQFKMCRLLVPTFVLLCAIVVPAASQSAGQAAAEAPKTHLEALQWLRQRWRKYGVWDYKQTGSEYRDYTQFNFGATGGAAGLDKNSLLALAKESKPTPADVDRLDNPELLKSFDSNREALDKLRAMTQLDNRVVRIAKTTPGLILTRNGLVMISVSQSTVGMNIGNYSTSSRCKKGSFVTMTFPVRYSSLQVPLDSAPADRATDMFILNRH